MIIKKNKSDFESYLVDGANIKGDCESVYIPETTSEVSELLKEANKTKTNVTVSASRTGLTGGGVPKEGILISTEKLNNIIEINNENNTATVETGVILSDFQTEVEKLNLFYPPDPTETNCSIGGTVVTNASGARTFKYGPTRNFIEEIKVVLPNGEITNIVRGNSLSKEGSIDIISENGETTTISLPNYKMPNVKHAAGYYNASNMDLIDLFIGSEGTLGIITQIKLKIIDLPQNVLSMIVFFNEEDDLISFVDEMRDYSKDKSSNIDLREIEFFDKNALTLLRDDFPNIPVKTQGAIWIEQEFNSEDEEALLESIELEIDKHNGDIENIWFALNKKERNDLKEFRHKLPLKVNDIISSRNLSKVGTDTAVPASKFKTFFTYTKDLIEKNNIEYVVYGHIGNSHLHFNMLPKSKDELIECKKLYREICLKSVELGGTISAEHGIGKIKTGYLLDMYGRENIIQMAKLKKSLDKNMILNIGNMFEQELLELA